MKSERLLIAAALLLAAAACSGDVTGPEPVPAGPAASTAPAPAEPDDPDQEPPLTTQDDGGHLGSGVGK